MGHHKEVKSVRISRDEMFMRIARTVAERGTCPRAKVGAVLVDNKNNIVSIGYNGSGPSRDHCDDVGCLMHEGHCIRSIHAEANAIYRGIEVPFGRLPLTLYVTHQPCEDCIELIRKHGFSIRRVVFEKPYPHEGSLDHWEEKAISHVYSGVIKFERYYNPILSGQ